MARYLTNQELVDLVKSQIGDQTQAEWARSASISSAYLSDYLLGRRGPGPAILKALGFETQPYYRKAD